jgi:hypothetical protein
LGVVARETKIIARYLPAGIHVQSLEKLGDVTASRNTGSGLEMRNFFFAPPFCGSSNFPGG